MATLVPDKMRVKLRYTESTTPSLGTTSVSYAFQQYNMNGAYDFNNAAGSTTIPGFNEWSNFYYTNKVYAAKWFIQFINLGTSPLICGVYHSSTSWTASWANLMQYIGNPHNRAVTISPTGGLDRATLKFYDKWTSVYGNKKEYIADSIFNGTYSSNPSGTGGTIYGYVYALTAADTNFSVNGQCNLRAYCDLYMEFFDRRNLTQ